MFGITVDAPGSRTFDDAFYCERWGDGWRLWVWILDATLFISPRSPDEQSLMRGVWSHNLSRGLEAGRTRKALTFQATFNHVGDLVSSEWTFGEVTVASNLLYGEAQYAYESTEHTYHKEVQDLWDLSCLLMGSKSTFQAAQLVTTIMVLVNHSVAKYAVQNSIPFLFYDKGVTLGVPGDPYARITSPLRRGDDLVNLRQLKAFLLEGECPYARRHLKAFLNTLNILPQTKAPQKPKKEAHQKPKQKAPQKAKQKAHQNPQKEAPQKPKQKPLSDPQPREPNWRSILESYAALLGEPSPSYRVLWLQGTSIQAVVSFQDEDTLGPCCTDEDQARQLAAKALMDKLEQKMSYVLNRKGFPHQRQ